MVIEIYEIINKDQVNYVGVFEVDSSKKADDFIDQLNNYSKALQGVRKSSTSFYYEEVNYPKLPTHVIRLSVSGRSNSSNIKVLTNVDSIDPSESDNRYMFVKNTDGFYEFSIKINPTKEDVNKKIDEFSEFVKEHINAIVCDNKLVYSILENLKIEISKLRGGIICV